MPGPDEKNDDRAFTDELLNNRVHRRNFLKFFAGAFATAALPEVLEACGSPGAESVGALGTDVNFSNAMIWVTRAQDGLSLGFQFSGVGADTNHNIAVTAPGYVAITFPPQHVVEDAVTQTGMTGSAPTGVLNARASGTSRIVFAVPADYGTPADGGANGPFPYTLQGILELCAISQPVLATNAGAGVTPSVATPVHLVEKEDPRYGGLAQARIDRVIARVDEGAAARVRRRSLRAARMLKRNISPFTAPATAAGTTTPSIPTASQTSLELPFRLLISPDSNAGWSFKSAPVTSPNYQGLDVDVSRAEMWHARLVPLGQSTSMHARALYTRDWDVYGVSTKTYGSYTGTGGTTFGPANGNLPSSDPTGNYGNDPVANANPIAPARQALVLQNGYESSTLLAPLNINSLILSPVGGTLDAWGDWSSNIASIATLSPVALQSWAQKTVLGRDEEVVSVFPVTVQPGGFPGQITTVNKRCDDPGTGTVGVVYSITTLQITTPLVSYVNVPTPNDYLAFPFVAMEVTKTKFQLPSSEGGGYSGFINDVYGNPIVVGIVGTDWKGNSIKFSAQLFVAPIADSSDTLSKWNVNGTNGKLGQYYPFDAQRIAYAAPPDSPSAAPTSYSVEGTTFETQGFNILLKAPSGITNPSAAQLVPVATNISIAIEAVRHLMSTTAAIPATAPPVTPYGVYEYDQVCYAKVGFDPANKGAGNPNEIFMTLQGGASTAAGAGPAVNFTTVPSQSGGMATPAVAANALSRATGMMSGSVAASSPSGVTSSGGLGASSALYSGGMKSSDFFSGFSPQLFGFVPLTAIIQDLSSAASQFMPKSVTKEISAAEQFIEEVVGLYNLITGSGSSSQLTSIATQVGEDVTTFASLAQGQVPSGGATAGGLNLAEGAPMTLAEMQAAAWLQSAATQAQVVVNNFVSALVNVVTDAEQVYSDITEPDFDNLLTNSLNALITNINTNVLQPLEELFGSESNDAGATPSPQSAAGAVLSYLGPIATPIRTAMAAIDGFLNGASGVLSQLQSDLAILQQGLDLAKNMSVEFTWKPIIAGLEAAGFIAFVPSSNQAFSIDIQVNATASNGNPAGLDATIRMDSFAIAFGGSLPPSQTKIGAFSTVACGYQQLLQTADVSLVFDHMQVQMLAGQKPDVDIVFNDIYFGGDLQFVETLKNLIPMDAFSDPPFVDVTEDGITAGFSIGLPNIAVGMFSIQNMNISASLTIPFVSTGSLGSGISFEFDFCTIENPFVVTVSMLGGGGFFSMWMSMTGLQGIALGIQVEAQLAVDLVVASGSVSIEVGIFLVYWNPDDVPTNDPVTGQAGEAGWLIGGYLRLRGELDVCGIITISVELYLQITYSPTTGKCIASGFISVDVSLFFFSVHAKVPFSRQFAGSNGDPTFAEMMSPGGVDPMFDPTLTSANPNNVWDPFTEYCMAYT